MVLVKKMQKGNYMLFFASNNTQKGLSKMIFTQKRIVILLLIILAGVVFGRLAIRAAMNFLLGGTLFGGNFL